LASSASRRAGVDLDRMGHHQIETIALRTLSGLGLLVLTALVA
jgi:hypothetical protein